MKLPSLEQYAVPRLETISPMSVAQEGLALQSALTVVGDTAQHIYKVQEEFRMNKAKTEAEEATHNLRMSHKQWTEEHAFTTEYDVADLPAELQSVYEGRDTVPAYEVRPYLYNTYMQSEKNRLMAGVRSSHTVRDMWDTSSKHLIESNYHDLAIAGVEEQKTYMRKESFDRLEDATQSKDWGYAEIIIKNFEGTKLEKEILTKTLRQNKEITSYDDIRRKSDLNEMRGTVKAMSEDGYETSLDSGKLGAQISSMHTAIRAEKTRQESANAAEVAFTKSEVTAYINAIDKVDGKTNMSAEYINDMRTKAVAFPGLIPKLLKAETFAKRSEEFMALTSPQQTYALGVLKNKADTPEKKEAYSKLLSAHESQKKGLEHNSFGYAVKNGFIKQEEILPFTGQEGGMLPDVLNNRAELAGKVYARYGISDTLFTDGEIASMSNVVKNSSLEQKGAMVSQVATLEEEVVATMFYNQLRGAGLTGDFALAGKIAALRKDPFVAGKLLEGEQLKKKEGKIGGGSGDEAWNLDYHIKNRLGNTHLGSSLDLQERVSAVESMYVYNMYDRGLYDLSEFREDLLDLSVKQVEGNLVSFGNSTFSSYDMELTDQGFERWYDDLAVENFPATNEFESKKALKKAMKKDYMKFIDTGDDGKIFYMYNTDTGTTTSKKGTGDPALFRYDQTLMTTDDVADLRQYERVMRDMEAGKAASEAGGTTINITGAEGIPYDLAWDALGMDEKVEGVLQRIEESDLYPMQLGLPHTGM